MPFHRRNLPDLSRYQRGTEPILGAEPGLLGRERLIAALDMLHAAAQTRLAEMDEAVFDEGNRHLWGSGAAARLVGALLSVPSQLSRRAVGNRNLAGRTEKLI